MVKEFLITCDVIPAVNVLLPAMAAVMPANCFSHVAARLAQAQYILVCALHMPTLTLSNYHLYAIVQFSTFPPRYDNRAFLNGFERLRLLCVCKNMLLFTCIHVSSTLVSDLCP